MCNDIEDRNTLFFLLYAFLFVWNTLIVILSFYIQWKFVILDFSFEHELQIMFSQYCYIFLAFKIYKYKMYCRLENKVKVEILFVSYVKKCGILLKISNIVTYKEKIERLVEMF